MESGWRDRAVLSSISPLVRDRGEQQPLLPSNAVSRQSRRQPRDGTGELPGDRAEALRPRAKSLVGCVTYRSYNLDSLLRYQDLVNRCTSSESAIVMVLTIYDFTMDVPGAGGYVIGRSREHVKGTLPTIGLSFNKIA